MANFLKNKRKRQQNQLNIQNGLLDHFLIKSHKIRRYKNSRQKLLLHLKLYALDLSCSYGLLGPSGCGKTTLLGCLVNRLRLDKGDIFLYGYPPGSPSAAVPGHRVGYMPQVNGYFFSDCFYIIITKGVISIIFLL